MVNNTFILEHIDQQYCPPTHQPSKRSRLPSSPCLLAGFEPTSVLDRTASDVAVRTLANARSSYLNPHTPHDELEDALNSVLPEPEEPNSSSSPPSSPSSALRRLSNGWSSLSRAKGKTVGPWIAPQPFEILTAIDKKDVMFLMEVRDRNFELLLKKTLNGDTPILYTLKLGKSHQEVAIILVGAFSRFVNHLDDADLSKPKTKELLRLMRTNLKQAIDHGLQTSQSDLISSFLQTLVMSEGERWVNEQVSNTATALRGGSGMQPVDMARESVRSFATRQLKRLPKGQAIASLEDYVANATGDLLMMAAWSSAMIFVDGAEPIPTWYFARDDRVHRAFVERLDRHRARIQERASKRLKWQIRLLRDIFEGRTTSWRGKVDALAEILDQEDGGRIP